MKHPYSLVRPCAACPFRNDIPAYLTKKRVREIERGLIRSEFACHETTKHNEEGEVVHSRNEVHCAGGLILLEKLNRPSQMMRIAERLGVYDASKLDMSSPVFDSFDEMAEAQLKRGARPRAKART